MLVLTVRTSNFAGSGPVKTEHFFFPAKVTGTAEHITRHCYQEDHSWINKNPFTGALNPEELSCIPCAVRLML